MDAHRLTLGVSRRSEGKYCIGISYTRDETNRRLDARVDRHGMLVVLFSSAAAGDPLHWQL